VKSLVEILKEQNTDKLANDYGEFYEELFKPIRHTALRILEIGIAQGGSLRAWKEYFTKADIMDLILRTILLKQPESLGLELLSLMPVVGGSFRDGPTKHLM
jgi:hypothetical protein